MNIKINGETKNIPEGLTVRGLINYFKINEAFVAVERNKEIVTKSMWDEVLIKEGDSFEIVTFVGGG